MTTSEMTRGEQVLAAANAGNFSAVEDLWLEIVEAGELADPNLPRTLDALMAKGKKNQASELMGLITPTLESDGPPRAAFEVLRRQARLKPTDVELREKIIETAEAAFVDHPAGLEIVNTLRLEGPADARGMADQLSAATTFAPGDVVRHGGGWGLGSVEAVDGTTLKMDVKFLDEPPRKFPLLTAGQFLDRVEPGSFDHQMVADPAALKALGKSNPAELVRMVLAARENRLQQRSVKSELVAAKAVSASGWTKFWASARKALVTDPYVEVGSGTNGTLVLRDRPVGRTDEILAEVRGVQGLTARIKAVRQALADPAGRAAADTLASEMMAESRALGAGDIGGRVALALLLEELAGHCSETALVPPIDLGALPADTDASARALAALPESADRAVILKRIREARPDDWHVVTAATLDHPAVDGALDDALAACDSDEAVSAFRATAADAAADARVRPVAALWVSSAVLRGTLAEGDPLPPVTDLLKRCLTELTRASADAEWAKDKQARSVLVRGRALLPAKSLIKFMRDRSDAELPRAVRQVLDCRGLSPKQRSDIERWLTDHHPHLLSRDDHEQDGVETLWVSPAGFKRRQDEFDHLMNVEFPKNAADLGEAISKGDLSENAEYDAARQRQTWLVARAEEMKEQLERAEVIDLDGVPPDLVAPGSIVSFRAGGTESTYSILGPWDVDIDRGIISYLSPMGQAMLGAAAGATLTAKLPDGEQRVEVLSVSPLPAFPDIVPFQAPAE
jgi:transcription elongation GreA/GreB family factor